MHLACCWIGRRQTMKIAARGCWRITRASGCSSSTWRSRGSTAPGLASWRGGPEAGQVLRTCRAPARHAGAFPAGEGHAAGHALRRAGAPLVNATRRGHDTGLPNRSPRGPRGGDGPASAQMHSNDSNWCPFFAFPAEAGTHFRHGHRPSPVWSDFDVSICLRSPSKSSECVGALEAQDIRHLLFVQCCEVVDRKTAIGGTP